MAPFGELLLSASLQVALDRLVPREFKEFARRVLVDSDLEELEETMLLIQGVLHDAEQKQITNPAVRLWLDKLTHLAFDIEDLLDEVATHAHRLKQEEETQPNTDQVRELVSSLRDFWSKAKQIGKIKTVIERLEKVWLLGQRLGLSQGVALAQSSTRLIQRPPTTPLPLDSHVYGREEDVKKLLKLLLSDADDTVSDNVSVIPIVGMGGVGKTTLAQLLYDHEDVKKHFTLKAWACVSDAKFDVVRVTKEILESATKDSFTVHGLQQLQERLKVILGEKKFLLVLDDVWSEDYNDWDRLRAPFRGGPNGSKIIVTTRSENVSSIMRTVPTFHLKELSEEDCQELFFHHAFQNSSPDEYPEMKSIGEKIVKKCKGLPLAAKTLGGLLRCKRDAAEWEGLLSSEIWDQTENTSGILPSLALSYHYLPAQLKPCFSYCAMFPQDYVFNKEDLILLWMAEGFLQSKGNRRMEDTGDEYFRELLSRSFFQRSSDHESGFVMHDLIHDLARSVSKGICFNLRDEQDDNNSSKVDMSLIRYALVIVPGKRNLVMSKFKVFQETKSLRALLLMRTPYESCIPRQLLCFLFPVLPCLRVLCVSGVDCHFELPESIGDLIHLRHLDLSGTSIERLPNSLCKLRNLQTLLLSNCPWLRELPSEMSNLTELRHLRIDGCGSFEKMPVGMNKLTNLQTLSLFVVGENSGSSIQGIKDMKQLRKNLRIVGLRNVDKIDGSLLGNKEHLHELELSWESTRANIAMLISEPVDEGKETAVLKELQPHTNLKRLSVRWYHGKTFPSWLGCSSYSQLVKLELLDCRRCQLLPPLGCLPFLKYLLIEGLQGVKSVGAEFYGSVHASKLPFQSLETMIFKDMEYWEEWFGIEEEGKEVFPSLCELEISDCPKLRKFSHQFVKLEKLKIKNCHKLIELPRCLPELCRLEAEGCEAMFLRSVEDSSTPPLPLSFPSISKISNLENLPVSHGGWEGRSSLGCLNALRELEIKGCDELVKFLCSNDVKPGPQCIASLLSLKISGCSRLLYLPDDEDVLPLSSVTRLEISSCPHLCFLKFPSQVETVKIDSCHSLKKIHMMSCTSLRELTINFLPSLPSSGEKMVLPSTIRKLEILGCKNLKTFPELMVYSNNNDNNSFLDTLRISECRSLTSFIERGVSSSTELPLLPKNLEITDCKNLVSLPERMMYSNRFLEFLQIVGCGKFTSFPSGRCLGSTDHRIVVDDNMNGSSSNQDQNRKISGLHTTITNVELIYIGDCPRLNSLPHCMHNLTSLHTLWINKCPSLVSFPERGLPTSTLVILYIENCENLRSLPDDLHKATSLLDLSITGCPNLDPFPKGGFPGNLDSLEILNCVKRKSISEWGIHNLTALKSLTIGGFSNLVFFAECLLPPNLTYLQVNNLPDLQSLPKGLHSLTSLEELAIKDCENLTGLPERGLPSSLGSLEIRNCPILSRQLLFEDRPKIAKIPELKGDVF